MKFQKELKQNQINNDNMKKVEKVGFFRSIWNLIIRVLKSIGHFCTGGLFRTKEIKKSENKPQVLRG